VRVAVCGAGNVGTFLAEDLAASGHDVLLIEKDPDLAAKLRPAGGVRVLAADACEVSSLQLAKLDEVDVCVAVTGGDEDNLVISLLAKQEFAVPRVIARVNHPKNHWLFNESWGIDIAVAQPHLLSALVEEAVSVGSLVRLLQFEGSNTRLVEVTLAESSAVAGTTVGDSGLPRGSSVVAIVRDGRVVVPRGDTVLAAGDEVLLLVTAECEGEVQRILVAGDAGGGDRGAPQDANAGADGDGAGGAAES
jgi:trk system potassium uptake protein TrkA